MPHAPSVLVASWLALAAHAPPAAAADADARAGALAVRALAATCGTCHGTDGRALPGATVPGLAGQPAAVIVERLKAFQSGARPSTVMQQIARGFSDEQIGRLADWFAQRQP